MPSIIRLSVYPLLVAALAGCSMDLGPTLPGCFMICGPMPEIPPYFIQPAGARMLAGDTISFKTVACADGNWACGIGDQDNVASMWTFTGDTAAITLADGAPVQSAPTTAIVRLRAVRSGGRVTVMATRERDTTFKWSVSLTTVDSSAVSAIQLAPTSHAGDTLRARGDAYYEARLQDDFGVVRGKPTSWSVSDPSVATIERTYTSAYTDAETAHLKVHKTGTTQVRAHFLGITSARTLTIVP